MSEEWGPWIEHDGKGCPCVGQIVECRWMDYDGTVSAEGYLEGPVGIARGGPCWTWRVVAGVPIAAPGFSAIIRYRVRKPRGLVILEQLLATIPEHRPAVARTTKQPATESASAHHPSVAASGDSGRRGTSSPAPALPMRLSSQGRHLPGLSASVARRAPFIPKA